MAIKSNKKIDFEYEHENDGEIYSISLRLHNSSEYGASIGILDENGDVAINFPVHMFSEVTDFLIDQGVLEGKKLIANAPVKLPKPNRPSLNNQPKTVSLPKPKIVSSKNNVNPLKPQSTISDNRGRDVIPLDLEQDDGDAYTDLPIEIQQQLRNENARIQDLSSAVDGIEPTMSLHSKVLQADLTDDELQNIMVERQAALQKQSETKKIRKK